MSLKVLVLTSWLLALKKNEKSIYRISKTHAHRQVYG